MSFECVVFPGQGAQKLGMAKDFVEKYEHASLIFENANKVLDFDVYDVCFNDEERLNQTAFTQPCIVTAEIAMHEALKAVYGLSATYFAGHSLGEYAALIAAQALPLEVGIKLVSRRGELMQEAGQNGGMTAIIMDAIPLAELTELANAKGIDVANDNSSQQLVLSGDKIALDQLCEMLEQHFKEHNFRAVPLKVSAPFHSRYMQDIEEIFYDYLKEFQDSFASQALSKVVSNVLGGFYKNDSSQVIDMLAKQLSGSVRWRNNMAAILSKTQSILELGPNRPLRGFFKTLNVDIQSVINVRSAEKVFRSQDAV